ncbi:MAG: GTPase Era [Candidatus Omnitrophica bacterium]|nr:GTPase Era [Candidatus Omnitrophota bacterium]
MDKKQEFKSGYVALFGKPNVGKSTLLNYFLKEKLSIVSEKPQTTRDAMAGIFTDDNHQIIFVDTPGVHCPKSKLGEYMLKSAIAAQKDADELIVIVDAFDGITAQDKQVFELVKERYAEKIKYSWAALLINKIDMVSKEKLFPLLDLCRKELNVNEYIPVSAKTGENLDFVFDKIKQMLPIGPQYYPCDQLSDKNERYIVAELIREEALNLYQQEIPHSIAVEINEFKERANRKIFIQATIFLERPSQKMILIGRNGRMLKKTGSLARQQIEKFLGKEVYLELWVKVYPKWRKDEEFLKRLGYKKKY